MSSLQLVFASIGSALAISIASLLWPKITDKPSPAPLTQVRKLVEQTPIGKQAADVLGVSDTAPSGPINVRDWAVAQGNAIVSNIEQKASQAVMSQVVSQIVTQIDKLPDPQKQELQQVLCATQSATKQ